MPTVVEEIARLQQKLAEGRLQPDEPVFTLEGHDQCAAGAVLIWSVVARQAGSPTSKIERARATYQAMRKWPVKQVPGRPDTRTEVRQRRGKGG